MQSQAYLSYAKRRIQYFTNIRIKANAPLIDDLFQITTPSKHVIRHTLC